MKYINWFLLLIVGISACQHPNPKKITLEDLQDSSNRTLPVPKKEQDNEEDIAFFDTEGRLISPDKFNQLLAEGLYISVPQKQVIGTKELHLIHTIDHEKKLEDQSLPSFKITDFAGNHYTSDNIKGKTVILSFWNLSSKLCIQDVYNLNSLAQKYQEKENVLWLAFAIDEVDHLSKFLKSEHWYYSFITDDGLLYKNLGIVAYPTHLIINEKGDIVKAIVRNSNSNEIIGHTVNKMPK